MDNFITVMFYLSILISLTFINLCKMHSFMIIDFFPMTECWQNDEEEQINRLETEER